MSTTSSVPDATALERLDILRTTESVALVGVSPNVIRSSNFVASYLVRTPSFGTGEITLSALQNAVTQAELGGGWVPLVFHGVCD